jgi:hypothetical protein
MQIHYITRIRLMVLIAGFSLFLLALACKKEEGEGGTSSITGKVLVRQYNANFTTLMEQYYAPDENVFIVYGDDPVYGDKTSTNYDGTYRFEYLREGNYTIYAYSEDSAYYPTQHEIPVIKRVEITKKNQEVHVGDIIILK